MLDVRIFKGPGWQRTGLLDFDLHVKDTSVKQPLCATSMHHPQVHRFWPPGQIMRFRNLCSDKASLAVATSEFVASLVAGDCDKRAVHSIINSIVACRRHQQRRGEVSWLVLPYRYVWGFAQFEKRVASINRTFEHLDADLKPISVRISWRRGNKSLIQRVNQLSALCSLDGWRGR